jgi:hypothetical protein
VCRLSERCPGALYSLCVVLFRSVVGLDFTGKQDDETKLSVKPYKAFASKSVRGRAWLQQMYANVENTALLPTIAKDTHCVSADVPFIVFLCNLETTQRVGSICDIIAASRLRLLLFFLRGLHPNPEDEGDVFLRNVELPRSRTQKT